MYNDLFLFLVFAFTSDIFPNHRKTGSDYWLTFKSRIRALGASNCKNCFWQKGFRLAKASRALAALTCTVVDRLFLIRSTKGLQSQHFKGSLIVNYSSKNTSSASMHIFQYRKKNKSFKAEKILDTSAYFISTLFF